MTDFYMEREFFDAIQKKDMQIIVEGVEEICQKLFDSWQDAPHGSFPNLLEKCIQRTKIGRSYLDEWRNSPEYYIGMLYGTIQVYAELMQEEKEQKELDDQIKIILQKQGPVTKKVFSKLIDLDRKHSWINHGDLAEYTETSPSSLTKTMKRLIASGAIESKRNAKYTEYRITPLGKRYYENEILTKQGKVSKFPEQEIQELNNNIQILVNLLERNTKQTELFVEMSKDMILNRHISSILDFNTIKTNQEIDYSTMSINWKHRIKVDENVLN